MARQKKKLGAVSHSPAKIRNFEAKTRYGHNPKKAKVEVRVYRDVKDVHGHSKPSPGYHAVACFRSAPTSRNPKKTRHGLRIATRRNMKQHTADTRCEHGKGSSPTSAVGAALISLGQHVK